jgi:hypothetical protein
MTQPGEKTKGRSMDDEKKASDEKKKAAAEAVSKLKYA